MNKPQAAAWDDLENLIPDDATVERQGDRFAFVYVAMGTDTGTGSVPSYLITLWALPEMPHYGVRIQQPTLGEHGISYRCHSLHSLKVLLAAIVR